MRRLFGKTIPASTISSQVSVAGDIAEIRAALEIRGNHSVDYGFVKEQRLREQLFIDNWRMENAALNLKEKEVDRFYVFCVNAFYQIENIVNYYFYTLYPNINDLLTAVEEATKNDSDGKKSFKFKRATGDFVEKNVGDIPIFFKMNALCNLLFPNDVNLKSTLGSLRKVRNEGEHRCQIIWNNKDSSNKLYTFFNKTSFNNIRIVLKKVVSAIKEKIQAKAQTKKKDNITSKKSYVDQKEYKSTILSLISKLEDIQKAYDEGNVEECENLLDIGFSVLASFDVDDEKTQLLQSQFEKWAKIIL